MRQIEGGCMVTGEFVNSPQFPDDSAELLMQDYGDRIEAHGRRADRQLLGMMGLVYGFFPSLGRGEHILDSVINIWYSQALTDKSKVPFEELENDQPELATVISGYIAEIGAEENSQEWIGVRRDFLAAMIPLLTHPQLADKAGRLSGEEVTQLAYYVVESMMPDSF
jgi:hypothetical protein